LDIEQYPSISIPTLFGRIKDNIFAGEKEASIQDDFSKVIQGIKDSIYNQEDPAEIKRLAEKAKEEAAEGEKIRSLFGEKAQLQGSTGLGINIPGGKSDYDIMIPAQNKKEMESTINRVRKNFESLSPSPYNEKRDKSFVMSGDVDGNDVDVVVGYGPKAQKRVKSYQGAKNTLSDEERGKIIHQKKNLKDAWILSKPRYKNYKRRLDGDLNIVRL